MILPRTTLAHIDGVQTGASWEEETRQCSIDIEAELFEGERFGYISAICLEDGRSVRVDLDRDGWRVLSIAALEMVDRFDGSNYTGHWRPAETIERLRVERSELLDVIGVLEAKVRALQDTP